MNKILLFLSFRHTFFFRIEGALSPKEIVKKAEYYLNNTEEWGDYNLLYRNCEHFARQCATEEKESKRVQKGVWYSLASFAGILVTGVLVLFAR